MMDDSFLPSDDSDDDDDEDEIYESMKGMCMEETSEDGQSSLSISTDNTNRPTSSGAHGVDSSPPPRPLPIRPKVQRRMSARVPSLLKLTINTTPTEDEKQSTITKEQLNELLHLLKSFPTPPNISHDTQLQTTTNMIYNNKITDTAVKLVSGIGKLLPFGTSSRSSSGGSSSKQAESAQMTPSPMHPSYSNAKLK
jgi:hypothetical protein